MRPHLKTCFSCVSSPKMGKYGKIAIPHHDPENMQRIVQYQGALSSSCLVRSNA
jgi:hypothetical protein